VQQPLGQRTEYDGGVDVRAWGWCVVPPVVERVGGEGGRDDLDVGHSRVVIGGRVKAHHDVLGVQDGGRVVRAAIPPPAGRRCR